MGLEMTECSYTLEVHVLRLDQQGNLQTCRPKGKKWIMTLPRVAWIKRTRGSAATTAVEESPRYLPFCHVLRLLQQAKQAASAFHCYLSILP